MALPDGASRSATKAGRRFSQFAPALSDKPMIGNALDWDVRQMPDVGLRPAYSIRRGEIVPGRHDQQLEFSEPQIEPTSGQAAC